MAIYHVGIIYRGSAFVGIAFFTKFCFLSHNLGSRYARKPIKDSKNSDDSLVSKKILSQKIIGLVPRAKQPQPQRRENMPPL